MCSRGAAHLFRGQRSLLFTLGALFSQVRGPFDEVLDRPRSFSGGGQTAEPGPLFQTAPSWKRRRGPSGARLGADWGPSEAPQGQQVGGWETRPRGIPPNLNKK